MRYADLHGLLARRPFGAFVLVALVNVAAGVRLSGVAATDRSVRARSTRSEMGHSAGFDVEDLQGRSLARFIERWELTLYPSAMWQVHTPERIAGALEVALDDGRSKEELLASLLPDADAQGWIRVEDWPLSNTQAIALDRWRHDEQLLGVRVVEAVRGTGSWILEWRPAQVLSAAVRGEGVEPWSWTRWLADGIGDSVWGRLEGDARYGSKSRLLQRRDEVWDVIMPSHYMVLSRDVRPDRLVALRELFAGERVSPAHMRLTSDRERVHPVGDFQLLGTWGWLAQELGGPRPRGGLERLCDSLFQDQRWSVLQGEPATYDWRADRVVRGVVRPYFHGSSAPSPIPVVRLTLELGLQQMVRETLVRTLEEHGAALAQAIVLDVESGAVRALDSVAAYPYGTFGPTQYMFTPGSTFKPLTMAIALEHGVVSPHEPINVGWGEWRLAGSSRVVREARGHRTGVISATECLAYSQNSGMVQIGLRVPQEVFEPYMTALGYGVAPRTGLGGEIAGMFGEWGRKTWSRSSAHASICFGHAIGTTLWQHAGALASLLRGGEYRPLSLVAGARLSDQVLQAAESSRQRVLSTATSETVRQMMQVGAWEGTGRRLWRGDLSMGSKTGTVEKMPSEACAHALGQAAAEGRAANPGDRGQVSHGTCYTSLICLFGTHPAGGRESMVLICVDEPTNKERFGSMVAGPAALEILEAALGVVRPDEEEPLEEESRDAAPGRGTLEGFAHSSLALDVGRERPWAGPEEETW